MQQRSDGDIPTDFLKDAEFKSTAYHRATLGCAASAVRDTCVPFMSDELLNQEPVFGAMVTRRWHQVQAASPGQGTLPPGRTVPGPGGLAGSGGYRDTGYAGDYRRQPDRSRARKVTGTLPATTGQRSHGATRSHNAGLTMGGRPL